MKRAFLRKYMNPPMSPNPGPLSDQQKQYEAQIKQMISNARLWRCLNPGKVARVQFNFPPDVVFATTLSLALDNHVMIANAEGLELLKALWPSDDPDTEPTVLMVKCALELSIP